MLCSILIHQLITHVVSQLIFKWIPFNSTGDYSREVDSAVGGFSEQDWQDFIHRYYPAMGEYEPWIEVLDKELRGNVALVAKALKRHISLVNKAGGDYVPFDDSRYPANLRSLDDAPAALTYLGKCELLNAPLIAMVGSRKSSGYAMYETEKLAAYLAAKGVVVVSGGAFGCDIAAHQGALTSGIIPVPTVVVLAGGLEQFYPRGNYAVFAALRAGGSLFISERLWWMPSRPFDFPVRNRLISGMVTVVLLMQAEKRSGAMVTAKIALDQGRELFALKHAEDDIRADGSALLIQDGATEFTSAEAFIELVEKCNFELTHKDS